MLGESRVISFDIKRKYRVEETIQVVFGEGGQILRGLYKAFDADLGRRVAVKTARIEGQSPEERRRALDKALSEVKPMVFLAERIRNIPRVFEQYFDEQESCLYIVMEWIPGETLEKMMGQLDEMQFVGYMERLCGILRTMEQNDKFYHKDIKPANIMIQGRQLYLIDFNITVSAANLTEGTPEYMAPEMRPPSREVRRDKADMFSIGVIMYEYYTKKRPVYGQDYGGISRSGGPKEWKLFVEPKQVVGSLPDEVNDIICRCMKLNIEDRFKDYGELESRLKRYGRNLSGKVTKGKQKNGR